MTTLAVLGYVVGILGFAFGVKCYLELWRWAKQCQRARIVIAHKKRVQIDAPLTDWLAWANQLGGDQKERGRVVYTSSYTRVAILRPERPMAARVLFGRIRQTLSARRSRTAPPTVPTEPTARGKIAA